MVSEWEARLTPLALAVPEHAPPASLWPKIAARIGASPGPQAAAAAPGLWASLAFWRGLGIAGSALAAALTAVLFLRPPEIREVPVEIVRLLPPKVEASYVAVLEDPKTHQAVLVAMAARNSNQLVVRAVDERPIPSDRDLELWALPPGAKPRSLGLVGAASNTTLKLAASGDSVLENVPTLAISLEPKGGSPTGGPTGPVLYAGPCLKLWQ
jgi:anti-sigma-K factor RskA